MNIMRRLTTALTAVALLALIPTAAAVEKVIVYTPISLSFAEPLIDRFERDTKIRVELVSATTGALMKRIDAEKSHPMGDVLWTGSLGTVGPRRELFADYQSANEKHVLKHFRNREGYMTRFTDIPSVLIINNNAIGDIHVEGYGDLLQNGLHGRIAMADPARSSSAYEHLVNMLYAMGRGDPERGWGFVKALCFNLDGHLMGGSTAVYQSVVEGKYAVGLTFEEAAAKNIANGAPVSVVYMREGVISKPDGVYVIRGARHEKAAHAFVDFMTSKVAQEIIATRLHRRSVRDDVAPPAGLATKDEIKLIRENPKFEKDAKAARLQRFREIYEAVLDEAKG